MEDGGIAHRLVGQFRFHVWQKCCLLLLERLFQLESLIGVGIPFIETDAEEDAVLLVACFHCHE